ncbi:cysteine hydrolase [Pseudoxanthomonas jiangsuensis]|uniref:cysteine hydrolase family protein n=1 Tax=Pseudoxanthomonas jiangsuensis TaxID=619688 RepID=UPI0013917E04|nr:cysteine hydrolase family protein [Pseudoxanthomonas jiangsuensis]KAF1695764.1 cysteine hydrolase [Pseudoxanthomonas jiangsuensis]
MPRRALLVIDVQNEYFDGKLPIEHPPVAESLPRILQAMDAAQAAGVPVVVVRHLGPEGAPVFAAGSHGAALHPQVAARPHALSLEKRQASAFAGTGLRAWLAEQGIDTLAIAGYMSHNCDVSTALDARQAGLKVEFLADAAGSLPYANAAGQASAEEIHRVIGVVLHSNFAAVTGAAGWIDALEGDTALEPDNVLLSSLRARQARGESKA